MSDSTVSVKVGEDLVAPIVEKKIQAAIMAALGEPEKLVEAMVSRVLHDKVDSTGKKSRYSSDNEHDLVEVLCRQALQDAVRKAMTQWIEENKLVLLDAIKKHIKTRPASIAKMFMDGIAESMQSKWTFQVSVCERKP